MRSWVKPFLRRLLNQRYSRWPTRKQGDWPGKRKRIEQDVNFEENIWYELTNCFNHDFGTGLGAGNFLIGAFGSVLSQLPKNVFEKLRRKQNVFYIHTPNEGAEVKIFELESGIRKGERIRIVNFPFSSTFMPALAVKGEIVHELAHVYSDDDCNTFENDVKTDRLAEKWDLKKEIKAMRNCWKEQELQEEKWNKLKGGEPLTFNRSMVKRKGVI